MKEQELMQLRTVKRLEPVKETADLIRDWDRACQSVVSLEEQLKRAIDDRDLTAERLGRHLTPDDRRHDEAFQIWYGDGLLKVLYEMGEKFHVSWRRRPTKGLY